MESLLKESLPPGRDGSADTLRRMASFVRQSDTHRVVKATAAELIKDLRPGDLQAQAERVFYWVRDSLRYVRDIRGVEEITAPWTILESVRRGGFSHSSDCDDHSILLAALLRSIGFGTRFVAVASGRNGTRLDHVRSEVMLDGYWFPMEATLKTAPFGRGIASVAPPVVYEMEGGLMSGLGAATAEQVEAFLRSKATQAEASLLDTLTKGYIFDLPIPYDMDGATVYVELRHFSPTFQAAYNTAKGTSAGSLQALQKEAAKTAEVAAAQADPRLAAKDYALGVVCSIFEQAGRSWSSGVLMPAYEARGVSRSGLIPVSFEEFLFNAPLTPQYPEVLFNALQEVIKPYTDLMGNEDALRIEAALVRGYSKENLLAFYQGVTKLVVLDPLAQHLRVTLDRSPGKPLEEAVNVKNRLIGAVAEALSLSRGEIAMTNEAQAAQLVSDIQGAVEGGIKDLQARIAGMQASLKALLDSRQALMFSTGIPLYYLDPVGQDEFWKWMGEQVALMTKPLSDTVNDMGREAQAALDNLPKEGS